MDRGPIRGSELLADQISFTDPNLAYILSRIRLLLDKNPRSHYALLRRVQRKDFETAAVVPAKRASVDLPLKKLATFSAFVIQFPLPEYDSSHRCRSGRARRF